MASKTLGAKLDDELRTQVLNRCQSKGCRASDYLKDLIKRDLAGQIVREKPSGEVAAKQAAATASQPQKSSAYVPPYVAKYRCQGCNGRLHENENYQGPPAGKCDSCYEKFMKKIDGQCPFCAHGQVEPLDEGDLEDMGLYTR